MTDQLTAIADRAELTELVAREALWLDEHRLDGAEAFFTDDVTTLTPGGATEGLADLAALAYRSHDQYERTHHIPTAVVVDLDGDRAEARFSAVAAFVHEGGEASIVTARYRVEARRTGDGWRFSRLEITPTTATGPLPQAD